MFFNDFVFFLRIKSTASSSPIVEIGKQHWLHLSVCVSVCLHVRFVGLMEHGGSYNYELVLSAEKIPLYPSHPNMHVRCL